MDVADSTMKLALNGDLRYYSYKRRIGQLLTEKALEKQGLRVTSDGYVELLNTALTPWIRRVADGRPYVWQQDATPLGKVKNGCLKISTTSPDNLDGLNSWCKQWRSKVFISHSGSDVNLVRQLSLASFRSLPLTVSTALGCTLTKESLGTLTLD
ncbi:hypothetical protein AAG570_005916 [Ranatra chinensis]|uniref:Uncharacterized protein n=1 Tax=Ranatra chinensis TaxID=642074 RepID=A0ABD0XWI9_9HEMI